MGQTRNGSFQKQVLDNLGCQQANMEGNMADQQASKTEW